jgi:hypothetical protein
MNAIFFLIHCSSFISPIADQSQPEVCRIGTSTVTVRRDKYDSLFDLDSADEETEEFDEYDEYDCDVNGGEE